MNALLQPTATHTMNKIVRKSHDASHVATKADLELLRKDIIIKLGGMLMLGFGMVLAVMLK